jgi:hypothetical protein
MLRRQTPRTRTLCSEGTASTRAHLSTAACDRERATGRMGSSKCGLFILLCRRLNADWIGYPHVCEPTHRRSVHRRPQRSLNPFAHSVPSRPLARENLMSTLYASPETVYRKTLSLRTFAVRVLGIVVSKAKKARYQRLWYLGALPARYLVPSFNIHSVPWMQVHMRRLSWCS